MLTGFGADYGHCAGACQGVRRRGLLAPLVDFCGPNAYDGATMIEVSVRELKNHLSAHLRRLESGETITVTRHGKPVALITPAGQAEDELTRKMRELVARGVISWSGKKPLIPRKRIKLIGEGPTMSEMVIADRG